MLLKSYFAGDVGSALSLARRELGSEAMLVHSRKAPPEARHLGECEVVVAVDAETLPAEKARYEPPPAPPALASEVAELRKQLERMAMAIARSSFLSSARDLPSAELAEVFSALAGTEVDAELAHDVASRLRAAGVPAGAGELRRALAAELASRLTVDSRLGTGAPGPRIVALVGPCGSGKTTTLVKLATRYGLAGRKPALLLSTDTYRVAAAEQLRAYAAILGIGFQVIESAVALPQALEEHKHKELILIDTPGHGSRDLDGAAGLARILAAHPAIDTHLVLTASMKSADLSRAVDQFEIFRPRKLLFTKLDETDSFGPILSEAARTGKPVSFLANGQAVPEDLEPATTDRIVDLVLKDARL